MAKRITGLGPAVAEVRDRIAEPNRIKALGLGLASFLLPWWAKVPLALVNGILIGVFFIVGHDACHGTLLPRRWMNRIAGRFCLLPALHPYAAWVHNHNGLHHGFTNIKEKDPGFPPLAPEEYAALSGIRKWLYRLGRTWYGLGVLYFADMWLKWEILPSAERAPRNPRAYRLDRLFVVAFALAWIAGLAVAGWWSDGWLGAIGLVFLGFIVPQAIWNWLIGFLILQQHTHPRVPWYSERDLPSPSYYEAQVKATPHVHFPFPFRFLMRHVMEHTAHHADPSIPLYRLPAAQKELEETYRRDMVRVLWTRAAFLRILRICRLYDYAGHRWVDYDGTPLTDRLLPERDEQELSSTSLRSV